MNKIITCATLVALMGTPALAAAPAFPLQLQWTWASEISACEAELTRGIVIRSGEVSFYDGPERLIGLKGPRQWKSRLGPATTYLATFVTGTSEGVGRDADRDKPYTMRYTLVGKKLYVSNSTTLEAKQFTTENRFVKCPRKSYR